MAFELLSREQIKERHEKTKTAREHITKELTEAVEDAAHTLP
jgi:ribosomal protein L17